MSMPNSKTGLLKWAKNNIGVLIDGTYNYKIIHKGEVIKEEVIKYGERKLAHAQSNAIAFQDKTKESEKSWLYFDNKNTKYNFTEKGFNVINEYYNESTDCTHKMTLEYKYII